MDKTIILILTIILLMACGSSRASQTQKAASNSNNVSTEMRTADESEVSATKSSSSSINGSTLDESSTNNSTQDESSINGTTEQASNPGKKKGFLGLSFYEITSYESEEYGIPDGICIESIYQGGSADQSDLIEGDIITKIDDHTIKNIFDLYNCMSVHYAGDKLSLTIQRLIQNDQYEEKKIDIVLTTKKDVPYANSHPDAFLDPDNDKAFLGIYFVEVAPNNSEDDDTPTGVIIETILQGSAADQSDLVEGDILTAIDGQMITDSIDVENSISAHSAGDMINLTIQRLTADGQYEEKVVDVVLTRKGDVPYFHND